MIWFGNLDDKWFTLMAGAMAGLAAWWTIHEQNKNFRKQMWFEKNRTIYNLAHETLLLLGKVEKTTMQLIDDVEYYTNGNIRISDDKNDFEAWKVTFVDVIARYKAWSAGIANHDFHLEILRSIEFFEGLMMRVQFTDIDEGRLNADFLQHIDRAVIGLGEILAEVRIRGNRAGEIIQKIAEK